MGEAQCAPPPPPPHRPWLLEHKKAWLGPDRVKPLQTSNYIPDYCYGVSHVEHIGFDHKIAQPNHQNKGMCAK